MRDALGAILPPTCLHNASRRNIAIKHVLITPLTVTIRCNGSVLHFFLMVSMCPGAVDGHAYVSFHCGLIATVFGRGEYILE